MTDGAGSPIRRDRVLRVAAFGLILVHLQAGSFARQVLHVPLPPTTMSWQMYSGTGRKICATVWYTAGPDGALAPLDRRAVPGDRPQRPKLRNAREVEDAARQLCRALVPADVRVDARCGVRSGRWKQVFTPDRPMCQFQGARRP